ncbi:TIM barrel protein [Alkalilacustris brevis]|uniref:TIM barrel protein n=1 Tax=Alkalilacustris brevis TaxID=2026338 RepID=UPI000E0DB07F|nr:TIM barrel protein [Alkalilacustris brevis]
MALLFSAHLGYLFTDLRLEQRFAAARAAGFDAVEHPDPTALPPARLRALLGENGLRLAQMTSGTGNPGEKGLASLPGREAEFRDGFARALDYAEGVECPFVHPMAGVGGDAATYRRNIEAAAALCEGRRPRLLAEAISEAAVPGYFMASVDTLLSLAADMDGRLSVLIDTFHACASGCDPVAALRAAAPWLGHVHIADHPGRGEPGTGAIAFEPVLATLYELRFSGAVGFEYHPTGPDHLNWLPDWASMRVAMPRQVKETRS